jgi:hypothetical protein
MDVTITQEHLRTLVGTAQEREQFWVDVLARTDARRVAEVGVFRGEFAERVLDGCPAITDYYMVDPWRHLDDWNKPANRPDDQFREIFDEAMRRTAQHEGRRVVLRGRTSEVIDEIPDNLDFAYIDADHTLRGITIDLIQVWNKVRPGGWIGGDDFRPNIWHHGQKFEPTMVFPFAVYFAEAVGCPIYGLRFRQFLIEKAPERGFSFTDLTGNYPATDVLTQVSKGGTSGGRGGKPAGQGGKGNRGAGKRVRRGRKKEQQD